MLIANFTQRDEEIEVEGLWQYDYGQKLQINGLDLPAVFEVHFAYKGLEKAIPQTGYTQDGVSVVDIPNSALAQPKTISAYIYLSDASQGETTNKILLYMNKRIAPEGFEAPADVDLFHHTLEAVNEYAERTAESEKSAEAWAHGHEDYPNRDEDNAKYYAEQVEADAQEVRDSKLNIEGMEANVEQLQAQATKSAESAENSKDEAAGYALSAETSRQAAENSEQNINAQITGFDVHVAEKTTSAENVIENARIAANNAIMAQQNESVKEVATTVENELSKVSIVDGGSFDKWGTE